MAEPSLAVRGFGLGGYFLWRRDYLAGGLIVGVGLVVAAAFFAVPPASRAVEGQRHAAVEQTSTRWRGTGPDAQRPSPDAPGRSRRRGPEMARAAQIMDREPPGDVMGLEEMADGAGCGAA